MKHATQSSDYRADIDGLRALAVLSVIAFHISASLVPGGFVGVDVFFVISGYLITRNIWGELKDGRFSLAGFYVRRIRRIAPALLAMTAVTLLIGSLILLPQDIDQLGRSALWSVFAASNVFFWKHLDTGYFAESSNEIPLLHTWSLGVEEQFYFVWPGILLLAILAPGRSRMLAIAAALLVCIASFIVGEVATTRDPMFGYYMLPARAGELMIGALLALYGSAGRLDAGRVPRWCLETAGVVGFGLIAYSLLMLSEATRFPGLNALYPCIGAALLIWSGGHAWSVRTVLGWRPIVYVGLLSYSLYLWHWPVLAFVRYFYGKISVLNGVLAVVIMTILAVASYYFVELRARHWKATPGRQAIWLYGAPSLAICIFGVAIVSTGGFRSLILSSPAYAAEVTRIEEMTAPANETVGYNCIVNQFDEDILEDPRCLTGDLAANGGIPQVLLWGDSLAAHYIGTLSVFAKEKHFLMRNATHSACPPVFGEIPYGMERFRQSCTQFRAYMRERIQTGKFGTVVISGGWFQYDQSAQFRQDLVATIDAITSAGGNVVVIGQAPWIENYSRECAIRGARIGGVSCRSRMEFPDAGENDVERFLAGLPKQNSRVSYVTARAVLCQSGVCSPYVDDVPVYYDRSHFSIAGSWRIGRKLYGSDEGARWVDALDAALHRGWAVSSR